MDISKKKPGRPRVTGRKTSEGQPILSARVGRDMFQAATELAAAEGVTLAEWVRNALLGRIIQGKAAQQGLMVPLIDRKFH
jgi:predicted HicB family RNase H-like nuclease